jgi:hypothetical protein
MRFRSASTHQGASSQATAWYTSISDASSACFASMLSNAMCFLLVRGPFFLIHWGTAWAPWHSSVQPTLGCLAAAAISSALAPSTLRVHTHSHKLDAMAADDMHSVRLRIGSSKSATHD